MKTTQLPGSGVVGATFKDRASLAVLSSARGYATASCDRSADVCCSGRPVAVDGPVSVSGDGDYETPAGAAPAAAGTYYWVASYSGDEIGRASCRERVEVSVVVGAVAQ